MSSTIDNVCININVKFSVLEELLENFADQINGKDKIYIENNIHKLKDINETYLVESLKILNDFYETTDCDIKKKLHNQFIKSFHSNNILGELDKLYNYCKKIKKKYTTLIILKDNIKESEFIHKPVSSENNDGALIIHTSPKKNIQSGYDELFKKYENAIINESFLNTKSDICSKCQIPYNIEEKYAEYICKNCGMSEKMSGVVFQDDQFFYQEGHRTKHGKYDPVKHAKCWLDRIQAREITNIPKELLNSIKSYIKKEQIYLSKITCDSIRGYLKRLKKTEYNNHVPLILKLITGIEPAQLTDHEIHLINMYFGIVIQIYSNIKSDPNCPYHPFFIYKIIEQILQNPKDEHRKNSILSCIHLQSRSTLIENDKLWFSICDRIPKFTKIPTMGRKK